MSCEGVIPSGGALVPEKSWPLIVRLSLRSSRSKCTTVMGTLTPEMVHPGAVHVTPTSSLWLQSSTPQPLCEQLSSVLSDPEQPTLSSQVGPEPGPK